MVLSSGDVLDAADIRLDNSPECAQPRLRQFLPEGVSLDDYEKYDHPRGVAAGRRQQEPGRALARHHSQCSRYRLSQMGMDEPTKNHEAGRFCRKLTPLQSRSGCPR